MTIQAQTWNCDCEETVTDSIGICIQVTLPDSLSTGSGVATFESWLPNECFAACLGFDNYVVIDCDSIDLSGSGMMNLMVMMNGQIMIM